MTTLPPPTLDWLCNVDVAVAAPVDLGISEGGQRRFIAILGGPVTGKLQGRVLPMGEDRQVLPSPRMAELDARYVIETHDGALIDVHNQALRVADEATIAALNRGEPVDPKLVYFRGWPRLRSSHPSYAWLNEKLFVCVGQRAPQGVKLSFYVML
jgi:Protein of unknown function (DUF3237)